MRLAILALLVLGSACRTLTPSPIGRVQVQPPSLSPELRNQTNRWDVHYHLNAPATMSSRIVSSDGQQWPIAIDVPRPTPGDYVLQFDGTVAGPGQNERRVLADGDYQLILDVEAGEQRQQIPVTLPIRGADTTTPDITGLSLLPDHISPNFDAQEDVAHVTYRLDKDALVSMFLDRPAQSQGDSAERVWMSDEVKTTAGEQSLSWDGTANGQPVPKGDYLLGIRARDAAGNIVESSQPIVIDDSGAPEASIVSAHIGPLQIIRGDEVCLDSIVRNTGQTVLRTQGPDSGYVYDSLETYSSIENHAYAEHAGLWRLGLSSSGSTDVSSATYPYRWGFGHDLQPGDEVTVHGCVRVNNEQDRLIFFAGLVQENVAIHNPGAGLVRVQISS